ncbi:MAG: cell surface protein SprA, partial [Gemmatimonadota bacterium]|nr:cell surface protein SprA [Gemmatimonadota bacterium]
MLKSITCQFNPSRVFSRSGGPETALLLIFLCALLPGRASAAIPLPDDDLILQFNAGAGKASRLGFKTDKPILNVRTKARESVTYNLATGSVIETITLPGAGSGPEMVLEVHHHSLIDYLQRNVRAKERQEFESLGAKYLLGEETATRRGARRGMMPEITLPDFMPKAMSSIIGAGTGRLSIHGRSVTELSGITTFQKPEDQSLFRRQSKFPRLKLDQRQQINIEGVIGTKIHVFVDYNSQNEFDNRNRIEVRYEGEEDEILQSLELGDVNLSLPAGMLVSASIPRGNFGIKGQTRLGPLTTTFIASKEEGESSNKNIKIPVSGEAEASDSSILSDVNFSTNRHFLLLDPSMIKGKHIRFLDRDGIDLGSNAGKRPSKVRVFKDDGNGQNNVVGDNQARPGYMFMDPTQYAPDYNRDNLLLGDDAEFGYFNEMKPGRDYILEECGMAITFISYVGPKERVGVVYIQEDGTRVGTADGDTLQLKLIKPASLVSNHPAWTLMLRNVYSFGGYGAINQTNFSIEVFTNQTPPRYDESGWTFLEIFGLDNDGDTKVDLSYIDFKRGLVFLPSIKPFSKPYDMEDRLFPLAIRNRDMYTEDDPSRLNTREHQKYNILIRYNRSEGASARTFDLGAMHIIENSERIYINDRLLRRGTDYTIDYQFGQLSLKQSVDIPPNAEVKVNFEEVPLFATGSTSLFGFHNEYEFDPQRKNYITSTMFFQSIESVDRTFVRLGDEPKTSMLGEVGGKFEFDSERLTGLLNKLPVFQSRTASRINITGGVAFSNPDPNTQGGVLIEDFETSKIENPMLRMIHQAWRLSSLPKDAGGGDRFNMNDAGTIFWFDPYFLSYTRYGFYEQDVYGEIEGRFERHRNLPAPVISVVFEPDIRASRPEGPVLDPKNSWRSIVQVVSETGVMGMDEREVLQMFISVGHDDPNPRKRPGKLIIDFGQVSEDQARFDSRGEVTGIYILDTEDKNFDGRLDHDEDTGLDQAEGPDPKAPPYGKLALPPKQNPTVERDEGADDYFRPSEQDIIDGRWINLTEGNNRGMIGASFDTEDLNTDGALDDKDNLFRVILDLETMKLAGNHIPPGLDRNVMVDHTPYNPASYKGRDQLEDVLGTDDWYMIEIPLPKENSPLKGLYQEIGTPNLNNVKHVRLTFYDFASTDTINFAAMAFVGNRFKKNSAGVVPHLEGTVILPEGDEFITPVDTGVVDTSATDTTGTGGTAAAGTSIQLAAGGGYHGMFEIKSINTILNNEYYPPPMVSATLNKFNRSGRQEDFTAQESAVRLEYMDLQKGYEGWARKAENNQQSYLDYSSMSFYINGRLGPHDPKPTFFLRIGIDDNNFYEYSMVVENTDWQEVTIPFSDFLKLKEEQQSNLGLSQIQGFDKDIKRGHYRVKGNPSLTKVTIMTLGVANTHHDVPVSGEVWIDDFRLTDVIKEFGINSRVQVDAQLSDLGRISFRVAGRDNKYRNLNESIPRDSRYEYTISGSLNADRFSPEKWGLRIPVSFNKSYNRTMPRFHPGSEDVTIQSAENKEHYKSETTSKSFSVSYSKSKGTGLMSRYLFDRMNGSMTYSNSRSIAPKNLSRNTTISGRMSYKATLPRDNDVQVSVFPKSVFGFLAKAPLPYFLKTSGIIKSIGGARFRYLPNNFDLQTQSNYRRSDSYNPISGVPRQDSTFTSTSGVRASYNPFTTMTSSFNLQVKRNMMETKRGSKMLGFNIGEETGRRQGVQLQVSPKAITWLQPTYRYQVDYNNDHNYQYAHGFGKGDFRKFDTRKQQSGGFQFRLSTLRQSLADLKFRDPSAPRKKKEEKTEKSSSSAYKRQARKPAGRGDSGQGFISKFLFTPINNLLDSFDPFSFQMNRSSQERWDKMEYNPGFLYQIRMRKVDLETRHRPSLSHYGNYRYEYEYAEDGVTVLDSTVADSTYFPDYAPLASMSWTFNRGYQSGIRLGAIRVSGNYTENGTNSHSLNG